MTSITICDDLSKRLNTVEKPDWYPEAVRYLRGGHDRGRQYGIYLYNLIKSNENISTVINIGTARGFSAVCAAKALSEAGRNGVVHTIDVVPSDEPHDWGANSESDPVLDMDQDISMRDFVERFHSPDNDTKIKFYTGRSSEILADINVTPDLVFHDGKHTYDVVKKDMELSKSLADQRLLQIHDDCYLYELSNELTLHNPINGSTIADLPLLRRLDIVQDLKRYQYSITKKKFPGVRVAVEEYIQENECDRVEIIHGEEHLPITTIYG